MKVRLVELSWSWPSGRQEKRKVSTAVLGIFAQALENDSRTWQIRVNGLDYDSYIRQYGGTVLRKARL